MATNDSHDQSGQDVWQVQPEVGHVRWGDFDRESPFCSLWGTTRGRPVDRYYVEQFLGDHRADFSGTALEVENANYLNKYGRGRIERFDILDVNESNEKATLIGDLATGDGVPDDRYDCFVITQTLQFIYEVRAAVRNARRLLKPGGVVLATVPGLTPYPARDSYTKDCCWSFTESSVQRMFADVFGPGNVEVHAYGNIRTATAFLWGMSMQELTPELYAVRDPDYPVIIAVRACKA